MKLSIRRVCACGAWRPALETAAATVAGALLIRALLATGGPWTSLIPAVWVAVPVWAVASSRVRARDAGFTVEAWTRGWTWLLVAVLAILVPFAVLKRAGVFPGSLAGDPLGPEGALFHLLLVVLPEEVFFRGYVQSRLGRGAGGRAFRILFGAALFALAHVVVETGWIRVAVFLPGVVMGWLREKTGGLLAPAGFHWLANLTWGWV
jgi:membrane protease YdiL (CAAX protease family)